LRKKDPSGNRNARSLIAFLILIAAMVAAGLIVNIFTDQRFLTPKNIEIIISNSVYPTFLAWSLCFLFACGYTDMSMGGVLVLGSFAVCAFGNAFGYVGVVLGGLVIGTLLIFINFGIFVTTKIPSWIASISLALIYEAISVFTRNWKVTKPYVNTELSRSFRALGKWPVNLVILVVGLLVVYMIYNRTTIGLNIRAVGGNASVARAMGINFTKTILAVGFICGVITGIACIIQQSYNGKTFAASGLTSIQMIFKPLAIALLAQILQKWINIVIAVPFCSIIIYAVFNIMTFFGVPSGTLQDVFLCVFVIGFGIVGQRGTKEVVK
jgi:ribose/xylose/arabinose/galactoside ABC-type transport system permease subunit